MPADRIDTVDRKVNELAIRTATDIAVLQTKAERADADRDSLAEVTRQVEQIKTSFAEYRGTVDGIVTKLNQAEKKVETKKLSRRDMFFGTVMALIGIGTLIVAIVQALH